MSWWEPVSYEEDFLALMESGATLSRESPWTLFPELQSPAAGWCLVEDHRRYYVELSRYWAIVKRAQRPQRDPLLRFAARALAVMAPDTPARASEVQGLVGLADTKVRATKPPEVPGTKLSRVGPWLEALVGGRSDTSTPRRRRRTPATHLRPLGGPKGPKEDE